MDFETIISRCIKVFSDADSDDPNCLERYARVVSRLHEMRESVRAGSYPRNYPFIPLFHYVDEFMDSDEMYEDIKELDKWYAENYRQKGFGCDKKRANQGLSFV